MRHGFFIGAALLAAATIVSQSVQAADKALLIGIAEYEFEEIGALPGTQNDLLSMQKLLEEGFSVDRSDIRVLRNQQATHKGILAAIDEWLINGTQAGDRVFLYYSGHGSFVPDEDGDEQLASADDKFDETLVAYDVNCSEDKGCINMVLDDELGERLELMSDRFVFSMFDSCNSGTVTRSFGSGPQSVTKVFQPKLAMFHKSAKTRSIVAPIMDSETPQAAARNLSKLHKNDEGLVDATAQHINFFAVQSHQLALEVIGKDNKQSGLFTGQVVSALLGKNGDYNSDGEISFGELKRYTTEQSKTYCKRNSRDCALGLDPLIEIPPALVGQDILNYGKGLELIEDNESLNAQDVSAILSQNNDANLRVEIQPGPNLVVDDFMRISVTSDKEGLLFLFDKDAAGQLTQLYPDNTMHEVRPDGRPLGWIRAGATVLIPDSLASWEYQIEPPFGDGVLIVVLAEKYKTPPELPRAFAPVERQREVLGELRIELDALINNLEDESLVQSAEWSMTTVNYQVQ